MAFFILSLSTVYVKPFLPVHALPHTYGISIYFYTICVTRIAFQLVGRYFSQTPSSTIKSSYTSGKYPNIQLTPSAVTYTVAASIVSTLPNEKNY